MTYCMSQVRVQRSQHYMPFLHAIRARKVANYPTCVGFHFDSLSLSLSFFLPLRVCSESDKAGGQQCQHRGEQPHPEVCGGRHRAVRQHHVSGVLHRGRAVGQGLHGHSWWVFLYTTQINKGVTQFCLVWNKSHLNHTFHEVTLNLKLSAVGVFGAHRGE